MKAVGNYRLIKTIGSGAFSNVNLAENIKTGETGALKIMKTESKGRHTVVKEFFRNEISVLKKCKHENIIKLIDFSGKSELQHHNSEGETVAYIALEYAEKGEIFDYILETGRFSEEVGRFYFKQLIDALEGISQKGYAHRDIKPENILLDKNGNLKLADFGFSTNKKSISRKGTIGYMAPEILAGKIYDGRISDIFSAGVVLFIMYTKFCPFINADANDRCYQRIFNDDWDELWQFYSTQFNDFEFEDSFKDLFQRLVAVNPEDRPSIEEIKNHEWFNGPTATSEQIVEEINKRRSMIKRELGVSSPTSTATKESSTISENKENTNMISLKKSINIVLHKENKRYTQFFTIEDPEIIVDALAEFAKINGHILRKSNKLYRVKFIIQCDDEEIHIIANILKKESLNSRCIQLYKVGGDQEKFINLFSQLQDFLSKHSRLSENQYIE